MSDNTKDEEERDKSEEPEMGFFDHLEELRMRIIYMLIGIIVASLATGFFIDSIMENFLLLPAAKYGLTLQNLAPFGQPFLYFKVILITGLILSFPFILYQLWRFIAPGLYDNERKWVGSLTVLTSVSFSIGVVFSYYALIPSMLAFAASFGTDKIKNFIDVNQYLSFITMMLLASGIIFEMPILSFLLARFGIITAKKMRKYWRHSIVAILIIAAVLTPTPDPVSQMIFAAPLFALWEISVQVAKIAERGRRAREARQAREFEEE